MEILRGYKYIILLCYRCSDYFVSKNLGAKSLRAESRAWYIPHVYMYMGIAVSTPILSARLGVADVYDSGDYRGEKLAQGCMHFKYPLKACIGYIPECSSHDIYRRSW